MRAHRKAVIVVALVIVLVAGAVAWATGWGPSASDEDPGQASPTTSAPSTATTDPATPSAGPSDEPLLDEATTDPAQPPAQPPAQTPTASTDPAPVPSSTLAPATVVITYASWADETSAVEAGAYAAIIEDAGTCTLTLTKDTTTRTASVDAAPDVSTTACGRFLIPGADLTTGTWTAVVTYASSTSAGQSDPVKVVVP